MNKVFLSGIGGIGMANVAVLLKQAGFEVSGSDGSIYEPAATVLRNAGITPRTPYSADNIPLDGSPVIIGNAQSRGHAEVEAALDAGALLYSFPDFLNRFVLAGRHSVVVAGTHGKSTTTACLSHVLHAVGVDPGFLIGALPLNFPLGAALGKKNAPFVLEGDEYDSAFFDKRSKFLHYFPRTLLLGTVEFDHADIFASQEEMLLSFRRLINLLPRTGRLIYHHDCETTRELVAKAPCETVSVGVGEGAGWRLLENAAGLHYATPSGEVRSCSFDLPGRHNRLNALMSLAAASNLHPSLPDIEAALGTFRGIRRRFEKLFERADLTIYDDFAHHPTAIAASIQAVREKHPGHRLIAVFEPRSNTMVRNIFQAEIPAAFAAADHAIFGTIHRIERIPVDQRLDLAAVRRDLTARGIPSAQMANSDIPSYIFSLLNGTPTVILFMSNGSFDGAPAALVQMFDGKDRS
ncbi:MAG TPA: Mur ligase family protein [bacterium]|jgi:UDP-N-acetylmuramate: L-alanyl-gamma-D-glutamyl-meso-diaminopimelate ligase